MNKVRDEVREYYGQLNELHAELRLGSTGKVPLKPEILSTYETCKELRIPLVAGGVMDQPYIWLLQYEVIDQEVKLQEMLRNNAATQ